MYWLPLLLVACGLSDPTGPDESPAPTEASSSQPARSDINVAEFAVRHAQHPHVIDVRSAAEFAGGHIPGAIHLPLDQLTLDHPALAKVDKSQPVYLVCAVGGRSSVAADRLAEAGYIAVNVDGGTNGWKAAGHPVESFSTPQ